VLALLSRVHFDKSSRTSILDSRRFSVLQLDDVMAVGLAPQRIVAFVTGSLGVIGVLLAAIGIYGVTALTVSRRNPRDCGCAQRLARNAVRFVRLVLRQALSLTAVGTILGIALGCDRRSGAFNVVGRRLATRSHRV
jgi:H+/gluconate symporter-like permease